MLGCEELINTGANYFFGVLGLLDDLFLCNSVDVPSADGLHRNCFFKNWIEQNSLHCKWKGQLMSNTFWFRHEVLSRLLMSHCHSIDREQLSFMFLYNLSTTVIEFEKAYLPCTFFGCLVFSLLRFLLPVHQLFFFSPGIWT